jgi:short subunit dehydrogenase-like uncharacterized protein
VSTERASRSSRPYDVVIWGATGFTGRLAAEYIARAHGVGRDLRWAIAGRSHEKLASVRDGLAAIDPRARELAILVGDSRDAASLAPIVSQTRVVLTTVGPYAIYGHELVAACVEHGTDSVDLTGEPQFVRATIDRHHARARQTGARIVNCCGFDSIPSDLGVLLVQTEMRARHGTRCAEVKYFAGEMSGGMSGGTIASAMHIAEEMAHDPGVRRIVANPYALDPDRTDRGPDGPDQKGVRFDEDLQRWTGPFMMAAINTRIVRRTNALLDYAYGRDFRYSECQSFKEGAKGFLEATGLTVGLGVFLAAAAMPPTRALLERLLPAPGEGPSKEARDRGFFVTRLVGIGEPSAPGGAPRLLATIRGKSDPGYGETAKMIGESAICLARDDVAPRGGVLTPASCMGLKLVDRLRAAGMDFAVEEMSPRVAR